MTRNARSMPTIRYPAIVWQHRPRAGAVAGPDAPELQVLGESAPRQRVRCVATLGGHERQREDAGERQERGDLRRHLLDREAGLGQRGVVAHPQQRPLVEPGQKLRKGDRPAPDERHAPQHPPLPEQHEQPDADAAVLGNRAGRVGVERRARVILRQPLPKSVGCPVGAEAHFHLAHLAPAEVTNDPLIGMERAVAQQPRERLGAAPFELHETADAIVHPEAGGLSVVRRSPVELAGESSGLGQGRRAIHLEIELDDGERAREVDDGERRARNGKSGERPPGRPVSASWLAPFGVLVRRRPNGRSPRTGNR